MTYAPTLLNSCRYALGLLANSYGPPSELLPVHMQLVAAEAYHL